MNKEYKEISGFGDSLEKVIYTLWDYQKRGIYACCDFNGHKLYSNTVSLDGAYKEIVGKTFEESKEDERKWHDNYEKEEKEFKESVPSLVTEWRLKGHNILTEDHWEYWDRIVPIRLGDLYHGMELGCCLDIVKILNNGGTLDEAKAMIDSQDHSGMSYGLVRNMVKEFCDRGNEFAEYVRC